MGLASGMSSVVCGHGGELVYAQSRSGEEEGVSEA